jgi:hypothetical protein
MFAKVTITKYIHTHTYNSTAAMETQNVNMLPLGIKSLQFLLAERYSLLSFTLCGQDYKMHKYDVGYYM